MDWANGRNIGVSGLRQTGRTVGQMGRTPSYWAEYRTGQTGRTRVDKADGAEGGVLGRAWRDVMGGLGSLRRACQRTRRTNWDAHVQVDWPLRVLGPRGFQEC